MKTKFLLLALSLCVLAPSVNADTHGSINRNTATFGEGGAASPQGSNAIKSATCPFSCESQGLTRDKCRDWREGDTCYVEDLRAGGQGRARYHWSGEDAVDMSDVKKRPRNYNNLGEDTLDRQMYHQ